MGALSEGITMSSLLPKGRTLEEGGGERGVAYPTFGSDKRRSGANTLAGPKVPKAEGEQTQGTLDRDSSLIAAGGDFVNGDGAGEGEQCGHAC